MPSVIENEGRVCRFGDADDLRHNIAAALSNPDDLKNMGSNGRQKVLHRYTWDIIGMKAEQAIKGVYEN
jgi:glycosyltransferase involved in cell wall biosynthesis